MIYQGNRSIAVTRVHHLNLPESKEPKLWHGCRRKFDFDGQKIEAEMSVDKKIPKIARGVFGSGGQRFSAEESLY